VRELGIYLGSTDFGGDNRASNFNRKKSGCKRCPVKRRPALLGSNQPRDNRMWGALKNAPGGAGRSAPPNSLQNKQCSLHMPLKPNKISLSEAIPFQDFGEIARAYL